MSRFRPERVVTGRELHHAFRQRLTDEERHLADLHDGKWIAAASLDRTVKVWGAWPQDEGLVQGAGPLVNPLLFDWR
jgi:WD40 repeat protein